MKILKKISKIVLYSYYCIFFFQVKKYFSKFVNQDLVNEEIWFDFEDTPLKPHLPIGKLQEYFPNFFIFFFMYVKTTFCLVFQVFYMTN